MIISRSFEIRTNGHLEITDITGQIDRLVRTSGLQNGLVNIFIPNNAISITTIRCEEGKMGKLPESIQKLGLFGSSSEDSQLKTALVGCSLTLPIVRSALPLSIWQQIILIDFGETSQWHQVIVQMVGEDGKVATTP